jgi:hypothetical protein
MMFHFKTARSGRFAFKLLNGQPALLVELPPKLAPSSGRVIGEPANRPAARELPRQAVLWIELDAGGNVAALHIQTQRRKLEHLAWNTLGWPSPLLLGAALVSALRFPQRGAWRLAAARSLASALGGALRSVVRKAE